MTGSRVRLRLIDDVEINEVVVPKGSYLYATMSGFGSQRVKGNVTSIMVDGEIIKVNLALYDTDGLEGLYVPSSQFRETTKDVGSGALSNTSYTHQYNHIWKQSGIMGSASYFQCSPEKQ